MAVTHTWIPFDSSVGLQPIEDTETAAPSGMYLGKRCKARHETYGQGEFIYLLGVASTVVGSLVRYWATTWQTTLITNTAVQVGPVAVAMSANVAAQYGWYQDEGLAVIKKTAVVFTPQVAIYISGTAGRVKAVASAGLQIVGARTANLATVASATSTITVLVNRPHAQSQIT